MRLIGGFEAEVRVSGCRVRVTLWYRNGKYQVADDDGNWYDLDAIVLPPAFAWVKDAVEEKKEEP